jgi:putative ABC transport system permease protein
MKCLGATDTNVLEIFLIEALLLGVLGGVIGACAGWIATIVIFGIQFSFGTVLAGANLVPYVMYIGEGIAIAGLLSVGAAAYPAVYAARLNPAEALRYEI